MTRTRATTRKAAQEAPTACFQPHELKLTVADGPSKGTVFDSAELVRRTKRGLTPQSLTLGRSKRHKLSVQDDSVSMQHARISWSGRDWVLVDLSSTNGTTLNHVDVQEEPIALKNGDIINLGNSTSIEVEIRPYHDSDTTVEQYLRALGNIEGNGLLGQAEHKVLLLQDEIEKATDLRPRVHWLADEAVAAMVKVEGDGCSPDHLWRIKSEVD
eukprot:evm.model.scf_11.27 EVM.evm.TU.scf_11.27   scf_11:237999-240901(+)